MEHNAMQETLEELKRARQHVVHQTELRLKNAANPSPEKPKNAQGFGM